MQNRDTVLSRVQDFVTQPSLSAWFFPLFSSRSSLLSNIALALLFSKPAWISMVKTAYSKNKSLILLFFLTDGIIK